MSKFLICVLRSCQTIDLSSLHGFKNFDSAEQFLEASTKTTSNDAYFNSDIACSSSFFSWETLESFIQLHLVYHLVGFFSISSSTVLLSPFLSLPKVPYDQFLFSMLMMLAKLQPNFGCQIREFT